MSQSLKTKSRLIMLAAILFVSNNSLIAAPPGIVINHIFASSGNYIGSPSLAVLTNGDYIASHDQFGPASTERTVAVTQIFRSADRGESWKTIATIQGQFWSTLFVHGGALYLIGPDRQFGNAIIRRSLDNGVTWSSPTNGQTGLLRDNQQYHCAPVPVLEFRGRLWRPIERRDPPKGWGLTFCAGMMSAPVNADLLDRNNWTFSSFLPGDKSWLNGTFGGWLEGNPVVTESGEMLDILRVDTPDLPERAALVRVSPDGKTASFDPTNGFVNFPGGAKKFTIRKDPKDNFYWSLASVSADSLPDKTKPAHMRNTLALIRSKDLVHWEIRSVVLHHPDIAKHGFQYVDWLFDGEDIIAACRTAYDDSEGGAHSFHDANFLTFHRIARFRSLTADAKAR